MNDTNWGILAVFSLLSVLTIGGGTAVLPEMKQLTIDQYHWLSNAQFRDIYALGQVSPGPNMLIVVVIGYHVAGYLGALLAFIGFFAPAGIIVLYANRIWDRFQDTEWHKTLQRAMAPMVVGFMISGTITITRTAISDSLTIMIALVVFSIFMMWKINPALLVLAGAGVYIFGG
ncbi:MAG: chromate transporter [Xanthobacter sp.]